ncbi:MAG: TorF family putative porin [Rhodanobacteraceae bacterium]
MVTVRRFCAITLLLACAGHALQAHAAAPITGYVTVMNNYVSRGLAQSVGNPSLQLELDYNNTGAGFYTGIDATTINWVDKAYPGDRVHVELDGYAGYRWISGDWTFKAGLLRLQFPGHYQTQSPPVARPNTTEAYGYVGWRGLSAKLNYAVTDAFATPDSRGSWYLDLAAVLPLGQHWSVGAHLGRKQERGTDPATRLSNSRSSYTACKLLAQRVFSAGISLTLALDWTNADPALYTLDGYDVGGRHFSIVLEKDF